MISDPHLWKKMSFFTLKDAVFKTVIQLNASLHFTSLKQKQSEVDFWFSSYCHFSDIIYKTPSSGQNVISLFFNN